MLQVSDPDILGKSVADIMKQRLDEIDEPIRYECEHGHFQSVVQIAFLSYSNDGKTCLRRKLDGRCLREDTHAHLTCGMMF